MNQSLIESNGLHGNIDDVLSSFYQMSNLARREGLLSLEALQERSTQMPLLVQIGIQLIVDGNGPNEIEEILNHLIQSGAFATDNAIKEAKVIQSGLLSIQAGENPRIMMAKMTAHLGVEICYKHIKNDLFTFNRKEMKIFGEQIIFEDTKSISLSDLDDLLRPIPTDDEVSDLVIAAMGELLNQYTHREMIIGEPCSLEFLASAMHAIPRDAFEHIRSQVQFDDALWQAFNSDENDHATHVKNANYLVDLMMGGDGRDYK